MHAIVRGVLRAAPEQLVIGIRSLRAILTNTCSSERDFRAKFFAGDSVIKQIKHYCRTFVAPLLGCTPQSARVSAARPKRPPGHRLGVA